MNIQQKIAVGILDVAVLAELCVSVYLSNHDPDNFASSGFFSDFFIMLVPTLILAWILIPRLGRGVPAMEEAPGQQ